jgi:hypothetical protein
LVSGFVPPDGDTTGEPPTGMYGDAPSPHPDSTAAPNSAVTITERRTVFGKAFLSKRMISFFSL